MKTKMKSYLFESEFKISPEEKKAFLEKVRSLQTFKNEIYRTSRLKEITREIGTMIESCESVTLDETKDGWFDNVTVSRDMKRLKESYKVFEKTAREISSLQQRLESCYEDIAGGLSRYYEI